MSLLIYIYCNLFHFHIIFHHFQSMEILFVHISVIVKACKLAAHEFSLNMSCSYPNTIILYFIKLLSHLSFKILYREKWREAMENSLLMGVIWENVSDLSLLGLNSLMFLEFPRRGLVISFSSALV